MSLLSRLWSLQIIPQKLGHQGGPVWKLPQRKVRQWIRGWSPNTASDRPSPITALLHCHQSWNHMEPDAGNSGIQFQSCFVVFRRRRFLPGGTTEITKNLPLQVRTKYNIQCFLQKKLQYMPAQIVVGSNLSLLYGHNYLLKYVCVRICFT
jgi:hypothetical protein